MSKKGIRGFERPTTETLHKESIDGLVLDLD